MSKCETLSNLIYRDAIVDLSGIGEYREYLSATSTHFSLHHLKSLLNYSIRGAQIRHAATNTMTDWHTDSLYMFMFASTTHPPTEALFFPPCQRCNTFASYSTVERLPSQHPLQLLHLTIQHLRQNLQIQCQTTMPLKASLMLFRIRRWPRPRFFSMSLIM